MIAVLYLLAGVHLMELVSDYKKKKKVLRLVWSPILLEL